MVIVRIRGCVGKSPEWMAWDIHSIHDHWVFMFEIAVASLALDSIYSIKSILNFFNFYISDSWLIACHSWIGNTFSFSWMHKIWNIFNTWLHLRFHEIQLNASTLILKCALGRKFLVERSGPWRWLGLCTLFLLKIARRNVIRLRTYIWIPSGKSSEVTLEI